MTIHQISSQKESDPNPFRERAQRARVEADALHAPTAHERGMADAFPLGPGFGRGSGSRRAKRIDASVARATRASQAERDARWLEAQAAAYDAGEINAQGRAMNAAAKVRSDKRAAAKAQREVRIAEARAIRDSLPRHEVPPDVWATSHGYLAGPARDLCIYSQQEYIAANPAGEPSNNTEGET